MLESNGAALQRWTGSTLQAPQSGSCGTRLANYFFKLMDVANDKEEIRKNKSLFSHSFGF